jgi:hypothetical protein
MSGYQGYRGKHKGFHGRFLLAICLSGLFAAPLTGVAKGGSKVHPFRKVDTTPNTRNDDGWDVQIASYNIPAYGGGAQNYEWDSYVNLSKTFDFSAQFKAIAGMQNGTTLFSTTRQYHNIDYGLLVYLPTPAVNLHAGPYWANKALTVTKDTLGYTAGFSVEAIKNTLTVQGDYFSGSNNVSGAVVNVFYRIFPKAQVYFGVGVPETNSGNEFYGIVGFILASK